MGDGEYGEAAGSGAAARSGSGQVSGLGDAGGPLQRTCKARVATSPLLLRRTTPVQPTTPLLLPSPLMQPFSNPLAGGAAEEDEGAANPLFQGSSGAAGKPATNTSFKPAGRK